MTSTTLRLNLDRKSAQCALIFLILSVGANIWQSVVEQQGFSEFEMLLYCIVIFLTLLWVVDKARRELKIKSFKLSLSLRPLCVSFFASYMLLKMSMPASASLFLGNVKTRTTAIVTAMAGLDKATTDNLGKLVTFVFGAFELMIIAYVAWQALQIWQKRDEEQWLSLMKTPALTLGTVLAFNFIIGLV
jgi:hypothetical protein